jgi:HK97 family phage prohead protease
MDMGGGAPKGVKKAKNPKYPEGTEIKLLADHMPGMKGATATVDHAYATTVYEVTYTDTETGKTVKNHKWVIQEEMEPLDDEDKDKRSKRSEVNRDDRQIRSANLELKTRDADGDQAPVIEGYFAVFGKQTELWPGAFEEIAPAAFDEALSNDVRALINHDTTLVLGRNKSGTLELRADSHGLWGSVKINPNDSDAVNVYERVKRGDVSQCSFGFNIQQEDADFRDDGTVKWTLRQIDLHEVSICTFPQYEDTGVQARKAEVKQHQERALVQKKHNLEERLKKIWH